MQSTPLGHCSFGFFRDEFLVDATLVGPFFFVFIVRCLGVLKRRVKFFSGFS